MPQTRTYGGCRRAAGVLLGVCAFWAVSAVLADDVVAPSPAPVPEGPGVAIETWAEDDGFHVVVVPRPDTLVTFDVMIRSGAADDPPDRSGLANLSAQLILFGTPELRRYGLQDRLDELGASLEVFCDETTTILRAEALPRHADEVLALLGELIAVQKLRREDVDKAIREVQSELAYDRENDRLLGMRFFRRLVFSKHPYGNWVQGTQSALGGIEASDIESFRRTHYVRGNIILAASGAVDAEALRRDMPLRADGAEAPVRPARAFASHALRRVLLVDKPERTQNQLFVGQRLPAPGHPRWNAMRVASAILGGNFSSRLNRDLRAERGWTYAIESELWRNPRAGTLVIWTFVAPELAPDAVGVIVEHLEKLRREGVTAEEVTNATGYVAGNVILDHATPAEMALEAARWLHYGQPVDTLQAKAAAIRTLEVEDVERAIEEMLAPDMLDVAMTCTAKHFEKIFTNFPRVGSVQVAAYDEQ